MKIRGLVLVVLLAALPARAEDEAGRRGAVDYARAVTALAEVAVPADARGRAEAAVEDLLAGGRGDDATRPARGRAVLLRLGDAGLVAVGQRLAAGDLAAGDVARLLQIVAVAEHPAADALLAAAATSTDVTSRLLAADGLAWGRTPEAVPVLARLAEDPTPAVRAAALRGLFALETDAAIAARHALPLDPLPDLAARRLAWHRTRGHAGPDLLPLAEAAWRRGRTPEERIEGARLLTEASLQVSPDLAEALIEEFGTDVAGAELARLRLDVPTGGYDPVEERGIAIRAVWAPIFRGTDAQRADALDRAVGWLADPVATDPFDERAVPEMVLRMVLPDFGDAIAEPTRRRLRDGRFADPQDGVFLLTEALAPEAAAAELGALLRADPPPPRAVRVAAAEGLVTLGRLDDPALAALALDPTENRVVRRALVRALAGEEAAWALPTLERLVMSTTEDLRDTAVQSLERRREDAAREILVAYLFSENATYRDQRMLHLVEPADDLAFAVLERALASDRIGLRKAALQHLGHLKSLRTPRARELVLAYTDRYGPGGTPREEWQELLYAWIAQAPDETIRLVREHWDAYEEPEREFRSNAIKTLQNLRTPATDPAVIDFVLEKVDWDGQEPKGPPLRLIYAGVALSGRHGYRDDELARFWRALLRHPDSTVVMAAVRSLDHRFCPDDLSDLLLPMLAKLDLGDPSDVDEATDLLEVLARQPEAQVENTLLALVRDAGADPVLRRDAGRLLVGRVSDAGREVLLDWLLRESADPAQTGVQRVVARVVGTDGGREVAARVAGALRERIVALFAEDGRLDPDEEVEPQLGEHLGALARAIAFTRDREALSALARLVFLPELATFARRGVDRQAARIGPADPSAAARDGPSVLERWHRAGGPYAGLPAEIWYLVDEMKVADDDALASAFTHALEASAGIEAFPDLYFDRIIAQLHDKRSGDLAKAAAVLERYAWRAEPVGGAVDFGIAQDRMRRLVWEKRFAEAVAEQERALGILARRAYDDDRGWSWRNERATLEALRAAAAAAAGDLEVAETGFVTARQMHPYSARVLRDVAWLRALVGCDLDAALADAERAATLERRQSPRGAASSEAGDVLAWVHLVRDEPLVAAEILQGVVRYTERRPHLGGRTHLHFAEALLRAGYPADAWKALRTALVMEPSLAPEIRQVASFQPWWDDGRMDRLLVEEHDRFLDRLDRD